MPAKKKTQVAKRKNAKRPARARKSAPAVVPDVTHVTALTSGFVSKLFSAVPGSVLSVASSVLAVVVVLKFAGIDIARPVNSLSDAYVKSMSQSAETISTSVGTIKTEFSQQIKRLDEIEKIVAEKNDVTAGAVDKLGKNIDESIATLGGKYDSTNQMIASISSNIKETRTVIATLQTDVKNLKERTADLEEQVNEIQNEGPEAPANTPSLTYPR